MKLASDLAQTLIEQAPQTLENPQVLPNRALLLLANFLRRQKDKRAVALYEEVLNRQPKRVPTWSNQVDGALYNLANYYASINQIPKAIETMTRIYEFTTFPPMLANFELQIARFHAQAGDQEQAAQWYETAEERGSPRATGVTRMDGVEALFRAGKVAEARALLLKPLGKMTPEESAKEQIQIALLTRLAQSYFDEGDLENASRYVGQAVTLWKEAAQSTDPYVKAYGPMAQRLAERIEARQKSPFWWETESVFLLSATRGQPSSQRLVLHFKNAPKGDVEFSCDNPAVRIEPIIATAPGQNPNQRVVYLSLLPGAEKQAFNAVLIARAAEFAPQEARLTVHHQVLIPTPPATFRSTPTAPVPVKP